MSTDYYQLNLGHLPSAFIQRVKGCGAAYYTLSPGLRVLFVLPLLKKGLDWIVAPKKFQRKLPEVEGAFYQLQHETIEVTQKYFNENPISLSRIWQTFSRVYRTEKVESVLKYQVQVEIKKLLLFLNLIEFNDHLSDELVLPNRNHFRFVLERGGPYKRVDFSGSLKPSLVVSLFRLVWNWTKLIPFIFRQGMCISYRPQTTYSVGFRAHWPRGKGLLRTDFLLDGGNFTKENLLFFFNSKLTSHGKKMAQLLDSREYSYQIMDGLKIPVSYLPTLLADQVLLPLKLFFLGGISKERENFCRVLEILDLLRGSRIDLLLKWFPVNVLISFHSAGYENMVAPILCDRRHCQFVSYNFGITVFQAQWSDYAFGNAHRFLSWGHDVTKVYEDFHNIDKIEQIGFWGYEEYKKAQEQRENLKKSLGVQAGENLAVFYDCPYFPERSPFHPDLLADFYQAVLRAADLQNTKVLLKMKNRANENLNLYPSRMKERFKSLWDKMIHHENIQMAETLDWDPLEVIAASDVNITLELSTPSSIALLCGKPGLFLNTVEKHISHPLFPGYKGQLIFDNSEALVKTIESVLTGKKNFNWKEIQKDLQGYNEMTDEKGLQRFRLAILNLCGRELLKNSKKREAVMAK